jgi:hypothetical protein
LALFLKAFNKKMKEYVCKIIVLMILRLDLKNISTKLQKSEFGSKPWFSNRNFYFQIKENQSLKKKRM